MRGAKRMVDDGLLQRVRPDMALSLYVLPMANTGEVVVQPGPLWASWDTRVLTLSGPPVSFDVARVAVRVTTALYDVIERDGQSAEEVTFRVRSLTAEQRGLGKPSQAAVEVHLGRGEASEGTIEINLALYDNDLRLRLVNRIDDNRFADDVGLFLAAVPGCLMLLGTANPAKGITEIWHRPGFDIDEEALPLGVHIMSLAALDLLRS